MAKLANLARMTVSSAPGTGSTIGLGSAVAGHITFANSGIVNGDVITYAIQDGTSREIGTATYSSTGPSLTSRTVLNSTASNAAINASADAEVFVTAAASDFNAKLDTAGGTVTGPLVLESVYPNVTFLDEDATAGQQGFSIIADAGVLHFARVQDDGTTWVDSPIRISRSTGWVTLGDVSLEKGAPALRLIDTGAGADLKTLSISTGSGNSYLEILNDDGSSKAGVLVVSHDNGLVAFNERPIFGAAIPWDSANFTPSDFVTSTNPVFEGSVELQNDWLALKFFETDGPTDRSRWAMGAEGGTFNLGRLNDAYSWVGSVFSADHTTGAVTFSARPVFGTATPWDSANFDPATKADTTHAHAISDTTGLQTALDAKAPLAAPTFSSPVRISGSAGVPRTLRFDTDGSARFRIAVTSEAESGSNAGTNLVIDRYNDAGGFIENVVKVDRATGAVAWAKRPTFAGSTAWDAGNFDPSTKAGTAVATTSTNGLMSSTDKTKLDAVGTMANRNVTISTSSPSGGSDGDVWFKV